MIGSDDDDDILQPQDININKKFWEELIAYFLLTPHGLHRKRLLQQFFLAPGTSLKTCHPRTIRGNTQTHRHTRPTVLLLLRVFVTAGTCLPSRCLATIGGYTYRHRLMDSGAMICMANLINIGSGIQKLMGAGCSLAYRQQGDRISLL
jgi:hypothetical protein